MPAAPEIPPYKNINPSAPVVFVPCSVAFPCSTSGPSEPTAKLLSPCTLTTVFGLRVMLANRKMSLAKPVTLRLGSSVTLPPSVRWVVSA